jgi:hypothetical protein
MAPQPGASPRRRNNRKARARANPGKFLKVLALGLMTVAMFRKLA